MSWEWMPPTFVAALALLEAWRTRDKVHRLHLEVNSRLTQLLRAAAREGHEAGVEAEKDRRAQEEP